MTNWMKRVTNPAAVLVLAVPWLFKIFPKFLEYNQTLDTSHEMLDRMKETIREHEETIDLNEPRDFTDKALIEIKKTTDPSSSFFGEKGRENLANTLYDLFLAGSETTATTLKWALLYMARYPSVQKKVQQEMDTAIGHGLPPSLKDKPQSSLHRGGPDGNPAVRQHPSERGKPQQRQGHRREQADYPCWHPRHPPHGGDP